MSELGTGKPQECGFGELTPWRGSMTAQTFADTRLLKPEQVRTRYGYKSGSAFNKFVHANAVPFIRLNSRNIRFDPDALAAWEDRRRVGGKR